MRQGGERLEQVQSAPTHKPCLSVKGRPWLWELLNRVFNAQTAKALGSQADARASPAEHLTQQSLGEQTSELILKGKQENVETDTCWELSAMVSGGVQSWGPAEPQLCPVLAG